MRRASILIAFSVLVASACDSGGEEAHGGGHGEHGEVVSKPGLPPRAAEPEDKAGEGKDAEASGAEAKGEGAEPNAAAEPPQGG